MCSECGERPATVAHHTSYDSWALGEEELKDLEPLCDRCHNEKYKRGGIVTPFFAKRDPSIGYIPESEIRQMLESFR